MMMRKRRRSQMTTTIYEPLLSTQTPQLVRCYFWYQLRPLAKSHASWRSR